MWAKMNRGTNPPDCAAATAASPDIFSSRCSVSRLPANGGAFCTAENRFGLVQQLPAVLTQGVIFPGQLVGCIFHHLRFEAITSGEQSGYAYRQWSDVLRAIYLVLVASEGPGCREIDSCRSNRPPGYACEQLLAHRRALAASAGPDCKGMDTRRSNRPLAGVY
jgi:hypothetical protein